MVREEEDAPPRMWQATYTPGTSSRIPVTLFYYVHMLSTLLS